MNVTKAENRWERKKAETKERIYQTAMALFLEQGYEETTVEQITERADVAKGTFFNHFPTKDAVLAYLGVKRTELLKEMLLREDDGGGEHEGAGGHGQQSNQERIFHFIGVLSEINEQSKELTALASRELFKANGSPTNREREGLEALKKVSVQILQRGQIQGEFHRELNMAQVAEALIGIYFHTLNQWLDGVLEQPLGIEIRQRIGLIFQGIHA